MKLEFPRAALLQTLKFIHSVIHREPSMPVLKMIKVSVGPTGTHFAATDLELGLQRTLPLPSLTSATFLIPSEPIHDFIRELPSETVTWSIDDQHHITVTGGKAKGKFNGMGADDYPALPPIPEPFIFSLPASDLAQLLGETLPAVGDNDARLILNALKLTIFQAPAATLRTVGTDGHRLVVSEQPTGTWLTPAHDTRDLLIPKKAGKIIRQLLNDKDLPPIAIGLNHTLAGFKIGDYLVTTRIIDGSYPNYQAVIPKTTAPRLTINKALFEDSLRRVSVIGPQGTKPIRLTVGAQSLTLHAADSHTGEATETLDTTTGSDPFTTGFNSRYLLEALETMPGDQCQIFMESPLAPCLLTAPGLSRPFKHIVMPISTQEVSTS